ncbi:type VII toxin-antitoxin system MntA family adenylyltransferase antitoxin [Halorussus halophilus]|uniref:type VII toxin-antitoxin system MntA family adenylyltransferase antitoxin n=1 Tax=Halorussus halophilus TaxID=2650975 RepID=UPI0013010390|nr:nucleotidyltransferase domain-containing protein [Halorussus halophilus]
MDTTDGRSQVLAGLSESLCHDPDIEFVVVFGSQLTGDARPSSDIDLAVKFSDTLSSHERFRKRCFLSGDLQREDAPFVDISDIETLPIGVAHDAVNGDVLCGNKEAFRRFKADIEASFEDQRDDIRDQQQRVIDRIAEDGLHG